MNSNCSFQQTIIQITLEKQVVKNDTIMITKLFSQLDLDKNGTLDKHELEVGFSKLYGPSQAKFECERIFIAAKQSKENCAIDLDTFLKAWINKFEILSDVRLKETFKLLDVDGNGKLSVMEIKGALANYGKKFDWDKMV